MSALPKYRQMDYARFDFRISNGLGSYLEPDWDDPGLGVEFYDSQGILRFTANQTSSPPLVSGSDRQGIFLALEGINLENFALGVCDARLSCRVNAEQVLPCPTVMEAFQVIPDSGTEPVYTTASKVKSELPAEIPAQLTDPVSEQDIFDASRALGSLVERHRLLSDQGRVPEQVELVNELISFQLILPAERVGIGTSLDFVIGKRGRGETGAGLRLNLPDRRTQAGKK